MGWREEVRERSGMSVLDIGLSIAFGIVIAVVFVMLLHGMLHITRPKPDPFAHVAVTRGI